MPHKSITRFLGKELLIIMGLLGIVILYFYGVITEELTLLLPLDTSDMVYPSYYYIAKTLKEGYLPLWDPHLFSGFSLAAYPQYGLFYPLNFLFWIWPYGDNPFPVHAYEYLLLLHVFLAGWFMYFLGRGLKFNRLISFVMGIVFMLNGNLLKFLNWGNSFPAFVWFPLVMLFAIFAFKEKITNKIHPFLGGLALGMLILAAPAQPMIQILMIIGFFFSYCIYENYRKRNFDKIKRIFLNFLIFVLIGFSIGAISILPSLELMPQTIRFLGPDGVLYGDEKMSFEAFTRFSMEPRQLFGLVYPKYSQGVVSNSFVGLIPFVLSLIAILKLYKKNMYVKVFTCLSLVALLYALNILLPMVAYMIPVINKIREPERYMFFVSFSVPILAAFGLNYLTGLKYFPKWQK